jgi:sucrose phosphorylase
LNELTFLYGPGEGKRLYRVTRWMMRRYGAGKEKRPVADPPFTEKDAFLITYGDQLSTPGEVTLATLKAFLDERVRGIFSGLHILPFFPYSSDDGFSVMDYRMVDPALGSMGDIVRIARSYTLMADLVLNHCSKRHPWFLGFLGAAALSGFLHRRGWKRRLVPRLETPHKPLVLRFRGKQGPVSVWTTFSEDQVDLNYKNPRVLLEMARILLFYAAKG